VGFQKNRRQNDLGMVAGRTMLSGETKKQKKEKYAWKNTPGIPKKVDRGRAA
jgi:hypothetical protein